MDKLAPAANARGVAVVKGTDFLLDGGQHSLRLAFSAVTADQVDEGVRRLAAAIADVPGLSDYSVANQHCKFRDTFRGPTAPSLAPAAF